MAIEYKLSYTANDINNKLGQIDNLSEEISSLSSEIVDIKALKLQQTPLFANSIDEMTEQSKLYVYEGKIWAYMMTESEGGEPLFTNLAKPTSSDWKNNSRINASGSVTSSGESGAFVSNVFDCKSGDILRVKGVTGTTTGSSTGTYFKFFPLKSDGSNFNNNGGFYLINCPETVEKGSRLVGNIVNVTDDGVYEYTILLDANNAQTYNHANVAKGRVAGITTDGVDNVIITINQEIEYSESSTGYKWTDTGYAFVPTDYEPRILTLEAETEQMSEEIDAIEAKADEALTYDKLFNQIIYAPNWEVGTFAQTVGGMDNNVSNTIRQRMPSKVTLPYDVKISSNGTYKYLAAFYDTSGNIASTEYYKTDDLYIPKNTSFRLIVANASNDNTDISAIMADEINSCITIVETRLYDLLNSEVKWCAMGDSITEGYVSYLSGSNPTSSVQKEKAWTYKVARLNNWNLTNIGIGGSGYIDRANNDTEGVTEAWYVARNTDFTPYNLVTLAYGINDWKGNVSLGTIDDAIETPTTIYGGMKATIEAIMDSNPLCKIIVLTPLNCAGYNFDYGTEATNWGLSKSFSNNGTLEEVFKAMVNVCEYYGIEYVDMTHKSVVNRKNILSCLTDGVHPNAETHALLAHELAKKISFQ